LLFIPFVWLLYQGVRQFAKQKIIAFSLLSTLAMLLVSSMHILLFVSVFIFFSHLFFNTPHRFQPILSTVLSNQLYLTILVYWMLPFIWSYFEKNKQKPLDIAPKATVLNLKVGKITVKVPVSTIQVICTDRPYTALHTTEHKYLSSQSLKALEKELNENLFLRVHRSAIINKNEVQELQSRQNGDYDAILKNGQTVRLSRHYRQSWGVLLKD
jgi:two-component system LytT family response regulator